VTGGRIARKSFLLSEAAEPSVWQARVHKDAFFETEIIAGNAYEKSGRRRLEAMGGTGFEMWLRCLAFQLLALQSQAISGLGEGASCRHP
jgi:hypothetical protein